MINFKTLIISLHGTLPEEMYERLNNSRLREVEEEKKLREFVVHKCCMIESNEQLDRMIAIRLIGGLYEEVKIEPKKRKITKC